VLLWLELLDRKAERMDRVCGCRLAAQAHCQPKLAGITRTWRDARASFTVIWKNEVGSSPQVFVYSVKFMQDLMGKNSGPIDTYCEAYIFFRSLHSSFYLILSITHLDSLKRYKAYVLMFLP
jgi:uncharacterized MAPEG superfamily protein